MAFSPDGTILAVADKDGFMGPITLWDVATRQPLGEPIQGHQAWVLGLAFSPDGQVLSS